MADSKKKGTNSLITLSSF